ncbi:MAG: hypothetical protein AAF488_06065 [Planctomycetota bacterium]
MTEPTYRCWTKGTTGESGSPRYSPSWAGARRAWFEIYQDRVVCGDWEIPFADVTQATVFRTSQMFIPVTVLQLVTESKTYQFGFNPWAKPIEHLKLPMNEERVRLKMSPFRVVLRIAAIAYLIYYFWQRAQAD